MSTAVEISAVVEPIVASRGLELFDVVHAGTVVRVLVDREGGVDLETLGEVTVAVSSALDDVDPVNGRYTLEVSSPGLERPLRRPDHFVRSVGAQVTVRVIAAVDGERRLDGLLAAADDEGVTLRLAGDVERRLRYEEIDKARTVFEWGPTPKPGGGGKRTKKSDAAKQATRKKRAATS